MGRSNLLFCLEAKFCHSACETFHFSFAKYDTPLRGFLLSADRRQVVLVTQAVSTLSLHLLAWNPTSWTQNPVTEWTTLVSGPHTLVSEATQKKLFVLLTNFSTNIVAHRNFAEIMVQNSCLAFFLSIFSQCDGLSVLLLRVFTLTTLAANVYFRFDHCFRCFVRSCLCRSV